MDLLLLYVCWFVSTQIVDWTNGKSMIVVTKIKLIKYLIDIYVDFFVVFYNKSSPSPDK